MADTISGLVEKVYIELLDDASVDKVFNRRLVVQMLNRGIGYLAARGVQGTFWYTVSNAVTAGNLLFTFTPPAHSDSANLLTTLRSIFAVRGSSDGRFLHMRSSRYVETLLVNPVATGSPTHIALFITAEKNAAESAGTNLIKYVVYPQPTANETFTFAFNSIQSMRFTETRPTDTVALADGAERALTLRTAALLVTRAGPEQVQRLAGIDKGWAATALEESETLIRDEAQRLYASHLADDILQLEA